MLLAHISEPGTYKDLLTHKTWEAVLRWVAENTDKKPGDYEIDSQNIHASIQEIETIPRTEGKFERHFQYIDLHYCIEGEEIIEWMPTNQLNEPIESNTEKDHALHTAPEKATSLRMAPGTFAIFFPEDAHMPKITSGSHKSVKKIVVKIKKTLVET